MDQHFLRKGSAMFGMRMNALFRALLVTAGLLVVVAGAGYAAEGDAPENAVDINDDLALVVDGEPFFPYGFCGVTEPELKEIAAMGCNTAWTFRARAVPPLRPFKDIKDVEQQLAYMDAAEEAGLKVIAYWENFNKRDRFISHGYQIGRASCRERVCHRV